MPFRILIIGAGLTGAVTASLLRRNLQRQVEIVVWEKSRGFGGRMNTNRNPNNKESTADLGAQYISASAHYLNLHASYYKELLDAAVLKPFEGVIENERKKEGTKNFMTPLGINSIVKHYFNKADVDVQFGVSCSAIDRKDNKWNVTAENDQSSTFDAVVVTIPVPQLLNLQGNVQDLLAKYRENLQSVQYSSRYAMALYFNPGEGIDTPWAVKYVLDDPCVRYISIDNKKRDVDGKDIGQSVVIHTSTEFGVKYLENDFKEVEDIILTHMKNLYPDLPKPAHSRCIRWRYSQVTQAYPGTPGALVLSNKPPLVVGGDAFYHTNFDGCVCSATEISNNISRLFVEEKL